MDYISSCPLEITIHIFSYLDVDDLLNCSLVCKAWLERTSHNCLWRKHCVEHYLKPLSSREKGDKIDWTSVYKENANLMCNWRNNTYMNSLIIEKRKEVFDSWTDGFTLILSVGKCGENKVSELHVNDVTKGCVNRRQIILLRDTCSFYSIFLNFCSSSEFIVVQYLHFINIFKCTNKLYSFFYYLHDHHTKDERFTIIDTLPKDNKKLEEFQLPIQPFIHACHNMLYFWYKEDLVMWDLECKYEIGRVKQYTGLCRIITYNCEVMFTSSGSDILVFEGGKKKRELVVDGKIRKILCNEKVIIGSCHCENIFVWSRLSGELLYSRVITVADNAVLHPYKDILIYPLYRRRPPPQMHSRYIKAVDLNTLSTLWKTATQKSHYNFTGHSIRVVSETFLVLYSPLKHFKDKVGIYDMENGKQLHQFPLNNEIFAATEKFLLLGQSKDFDSPVKFQFYLYYF